MGCGVNKLIFGITGTEEPNTNTDSTTCTRALVPLTLDLQNLAAGLKQFADEFGDVKKCRSNCQIDQVLLVQYRAEIEQLIQIAAQLYPKTQILEDLLILPII